MTAFIRNLPETAEHIIPILLTENSLNTLRKTLTSVNMLETLDGNPHTTTTKLQNFALDLGQDQNAKDIGAHSSSPAKKT